MRKFLLALIFVFVITGAGVGGFLFFEMQQQVDTTPVIAPQKTEATKTDEPNTKIKKDDINNRLKVLRNRVKLKDLIKNGDSYAIEKNYMPAIINYQKALKQSPNDKSLIKKIADAYYEMNNFKKAYSYYSQIKDYSNIENDKLIYSLVHYKGILPVNIKEIQKEIEGLGLSDQAKFYYTTALECTLDYDKCEHAFETLFASTTEPITEPKLKNIQQALENYKNFQSQEDYYKATYVTSAFYKNGFYYVAIKTAGKVISLKKWYQPVLKMAALSAYSIWDYTEAKKYLLELKKLNSHDPEVSYYLARVYEQLNEKSLAIVHYEKSLSDGYKHKTNIYRRLMFIYFEHKENEKMLATLDAILEHNNKYVTQTDYILAIYYNIINEDFPKAKKYARTAVLKYNNTSIFYGYQAWMLLMKENINDWELKIAKKIINKAESINKKETVVLLSRGIYEYKMNNISAALIYLKKASVADTSWEFKEEIDYYLDTIKNTKNEWNTKPTNRSSK